MLFSNVLHHGTDNAINYTAHGLSCVLYIFHLLASTIASLRLTFTMPNLLPSGNSHAYETTLPQFPKPCPVAIPHQLSEPYSIQTNPPPYSSKSDSVTPVRPFATNNDLEAYNHTSHSHTRSSRRYSKACCGIILVLIIGALITIVLLIVSTDTFEEGPSALKVGNPISSIQLEKNILVMIAEEGTPLTTSGE